MAESAPRLTRRELEVLALLADGKTNREIARAVGLSPNSIDKMLSNSADARAIYPKLGVTNAKAAITWYLQHAVAPAPPEPPTPLEPPVPLPGSHAASPARALGTGSPPAHHTHPLALAVFSVLCLSVLFFVFVPFLAQSEQSHFDSVFLNVYLVVPLSAGVYCLIAAQRPVRDARFLWAFRLFAVGLILWSVGAILYAAYDLLVGMEPHYPSLADLGFLSQSALQAASFAIWWRLVDERRGGDTRRSLVLLVPLAAIYWAILLSVRHIGQETPTDWTIAIDAVSTLLDCTGLLLALLLLLPRSMHTLDRPMQRVMRLMAAGMVLMFAAGFVYFVSLSVAETHWFYYGYGGWVDLIFLGAFTLFGLGLIDSTRCTHAFAGEAAATASATATATATASATASPSATATATAEERLAPSPAASAAER